MRVLVAAVGFAVLVIALFWWRMANTSGDAGAAARGAPPATGTTHMGPLEQATNRQGRDLAEVGLRLTDAAACSRMCAVDERCLAMSFVKAGDAGAGICWLKGSVPNPSENGAVVSAVKVLADH